MEAVSSEEEAFDRGADLRGLERLAQERRPTCRQERRRPRPHGAPRHEHHPARLVGGAPLQLTIERRTVELRNPDVDQEEVEGLVGEQRERLDAVARDRDAVAVPGQEFLDPPGERQIGLDDQDRLQGPHGHLGLRGSLGPRGRLGLRGLHGSGSIRFSVATESSTRTMAQPCRRSWSSIMDRERRSARRRSASRALGAFRRSPERRSRITLTRLSLAKARLRYSYWSRAAGDTTKSRP